MAIDAKIDFMQQTEKLLADSITVADMPKIMNVINDVLQGFEMRNITVWSEEKDDLLQCYISAMSVQCRSQKTLDRYAYVIRRLMEYVKVPTRQVTVHHIRSYLQNEKGRGIADSTLEGYRQIYSAYFNWLQRESMIERNPTANLGAVKVAKKQKKTYSEIDMEKLSRGCKTMRDRAIVHFLASTGCRISELTELDRSMINAEDLECIVHGKGNKERTVYLSEVAGMFLQEYLESRKDINPALFVGKRNERLTPGGVRTMLKELANRTGVDHVHPHKFRRTRATELARHGMPIQAIAHILGHEKIDTTMKYVVQDDETIRSEIRRFA